MTFMLKSFRRDGQKILIPGEGEAIQRAFYAEPKHAWDESQGKDVTQAVKAILVSGQPLQVHEDVFGKGAGKMLIVEAAIPACPVPLPKAEGFIQALRDEYVNKVEFGVGKFFDQSTEKFEPVEIIALESYENIVRMSQNCDEAISRFAQCWGVQEPVAQSKSPEVGL